MWDVLVLLNIRSWDGQFPIESETHSFVYWLTTIFTSANAIELVNKSAGSWGALSPSWTYGRYWSEAANIPPSGFRVGQKKLTQIVKKSSYRFHIVDYLCHMLTVYATCQCLYLRTVVTSIFYICYKCTCPFALSSNICITLLCSANLFYSLITAGKTLSPTTLNLHLLLYNGNLLWRFCSKVDFL